MSSSKQHPWSYFANLLRQKTEVDFSPENKVETKCDQEGKPLYWFYVSDPKNPRAFQICRVFQDGSDLESMIDRINKWWKHYCETERYIP